MFREWRDRRLFESTEQRVCDEASVVRKNRCLSQLKLKTIKRQVEDEFQSEFGENDATEIEAVENEDTTESEEMVKNKVELVAQKIVNVEKVNNNVVDGVDDTSHNLNDEHRRTIEQLNEIMLEGKSYGGKYRKRH